MNGNGVQASDVLPATQGQQVTYELHSLGWKAFQDLAVAVAEEIL
jgi:hypothetical protein